MSIVYRFDVEQFSSPIIQVIYSTMVSECDVANSVLQLEE